MEQIKKITIRLKKIDHLKLLSQCKELNLSQSELVRELIRKNFIADIKEHNDFLKDTFFLFKNISNNLNQIAKKVNLNSISEEDLKKEIGEIWQLLNQ